MNNVRHPVWDLPTRIFHWCLLILIVCAFTTVSLGEMEYHALCGYTILSLLLFRVLWGFIGSIHSRFSDFLTTPTEIFAYLRGTWQDRPGHNPIGGLSTVLILALIAMQVATGMINSDGIMFDGPYFSAVDSAISDAAGSAHIAISYCLLTVIAVHIAAVLYQQLKKEKDLIQAMLSGYSKRHSGTAAPRHIALAIISLLLCCALVYALVNAAPEADISDYLY